MAVYIGDQLKPGGSNFSVADQKNIKDGFHTISSINNIDLELPTSSRSKGMLIVDKSTTIMYSLGSDLSTLSEYYINNEDIINMRLTSAYINTQTRAINDANYYDDQLSKKVNKT
jgi:hypothetical protein